MTTQTIEREAKLFEAGSYPDRGIEITEDDLDRIIANASEAPIRIEHTATPFDGALGVLKSVYRRGRELFGMLSFTKSAWELVSEANAKRLSVAIKRDKSGIAEVSLVCEPRIADAAVFSEGEIVRMDSVELSMPTEFSSENEETTKLRQQLIEKEVDTHIDELKRQGKLAPASEVFARAILRSADSSLITFGDHPTPVSEIFKWFLESQPKVIEFSELATADPTESENEPEVFAKLGVTTKQVEKYRGR
ncbi:MAG: hypothetical protein NT018_11945 [Armatimonadetes bacterium]|nr:hypothetical protein [Armatimonadota bacterium]